MIRTIEFDFNDGKAFQSIILFIISSLVLILIVGFTENNLSNRLAEFKEVVWVIIFFYSTYVVILSRRLYRNSFQEKIKILINDEYLLVPTYYLGKKKIYLKDIYSIESLASIGKSEVLILGLTGKSRCFVDELLFSRQEEFYKFKKVLENKITFHKNEDRDFTIKKISSSQEKKSTVSTYLLCALCGIVYFISTSGSFELQESSEFVLQGAGVKSILETGEIYRIFTSSFLHVGIIHLLLNLFVLGIIGELLERVVSPIRFTNIFLLSILISYASFVFFSPYQMGVGASGGIFGLWGAYFSLKLRHENYLPGSVNAIPVKRLVWVLIVEFIFEIFFLDNVGYETHLGGFIAGFVYMYLAPLGPKLETIDQPTVVEKCLFAGLVLSFATGLGYFLLLYYGVVLQ